MYLHRAAPVKGKYIASVRVATYNPDQSWSKEEREANNTFSNDLCYISLLGSSSEILNQSLALYSTDAWYNTTDKSCTDAKNWDSTIGSASYNTKAAFLGVTYTNNPAKAIHGLLRYRAKDGATPPETLTVNGAKYSLVQNVSSKTPVPITSPNLRQYYLYATTSSGGSSTGDALTELTISDKVFEPGLSIVLTVDHGDIPAQKDFYGKTISEAQYAVPFGDTNDSLYIHQLISPEIKGELRSNYTVMDGDVFKIKELIVK